MTAREPGDVVDHQLGGDGVEEVGEQHDQRAAAQPGRQLGERQRVVGLDRAVVDLGRHRLQALERVHAAGGLGPLPDPLVEAEQADPVAGAQAEPAEQERGVDRVVELRHAADRLGHQLAGVDREHDLVVALGAELLAQELAVARRRLPVDRAVIEPGHVLAQRLELGAVAEVAARP